VGSRRKEHGKVGSEGGMGRRMGGRGDGRMDKQWNWSGFGAHVIPKGHEALDDASERLSLRELSVREEVILLLLAGVEFVILVHHGGRGSVGTPPDENLLSTVLLNSLSLVEALEGAVHALVEAPVLNNWQVPAGVWQARVTAGPYLPRPAVACRH
jgi:hypothetical protein